MLIGEGVTRGYWLFAVPALAGAWLMAFADPFRAVVSVTALGLRERSSEPVVRVART